MAKRIATKKSYGKCIETNDYQCAMYRYEHTTKNWKSHWWECIEKIYQQCKEFAEKYILDTINKTVVPLVKKTISKIKKNCSHTYLIKMFSDGEHIFTKIGKADVVKKRMNDFINHEYKRENVIIDDVEVIKEYELPTDDLALTLESFMRNYLRKQHTLIPNDRFNAFEPTEEDLQQFENYYKLVLDNA